MLTQKASAPVRTLKYGLLLPVTVLFAMLFQQAPALAQQLDPEQVKRVRMLEANNWTESDTIVTFDPATNKESMMVVKNNLAPTKDASGNLVYQLTEKSPEFPGGQSEMFKFMTNNLLYPATAKGEKAQGMVVVKFVVGADGTVTKVEKKGEKAMRQDFIDEAIRVVKLMPKWIPAEHKGKKVACEMILPVKFKLD